VGPVVSESTDTGIVSGGAALSGPANTFAAFLVCPSVLSDPWMPLLVLALLGGIFAEVRRNVFSPIINLVPSLVWFIVWLREQIRVAGEVKFYEASWEKMFLAILAVIIAIDAFFYAIALKPPFLLRSQHKVSEMS